MPKTRLCFRASWLPYILVWALAACGDLVNPTEPRLRANNHPGFDTSVYPGDVVMRAWASGGAPYEWVGFYLQAPCHRDPSWSGKRSFVSALGYGTAVIYVGQQTWDGVAQLNVLDPHIQLSPNLSVIIGQAIAAAATAGGCSRTLLSADRGAADALDAMARASAEAFPLGTVIFLDLERMDAIPASMQSYYRAWLGTVLADGRFRPGVYVHRFNASQVYTDTRDVYLRAGVQGAPEFWIAGSTGFDLTRRPSDVGLPYASMWQGALNVTRSYAGSSVLIDESVSRNRSPSFPDVPTNP